MRIRGLLMLGLAVVLGIIAVFVARDWVGGQAQQASNNQPQLATSTVVVASRQLNFGDVLNKDFVKEVNWPAGAVPEDAFTKIEDLIAGDKKRVVLRVTYPNEPILKPKISGFGGRASLSAIIGSDMRAVSIRTNDVIGVGGFVLPEDRVDVLLTRRTRGKESSTDILLQNVKVLAIDQEASEGKGTPKVVRAVTLEVTAEQAQKLALASQIGSLTLALRNEINTRQVDTLPVTSLNLTPSVVLAAAPAKTETAKPVNPPKIVKPAKRPRPYRASVTIVRGLKSTIENVVPE